jgi:hypothetical protein
LNRRMPNGTYVVVWEGAGRNRPLPDSVTMYLASSLLDLQDLAWTDYVVLLIVKGL